MVIALRRGISEASRAMGLMYGLNRPDVGHEGSMSRVLGCFMISVEECIAFQKVERGF